LISLKHNFKKSEGKSTRNSHEKQVLQQSKKFISWRIPSDLNPKNKKTDEKS